MRIEGGSTMGALNAKVYAAQDCGYLKERYCHEL